MGEKMAMGISKISRAPVRESTFVLPLLFPYNFIHKTQGYLLKPPSMPRSPVVTP